MKLKVHKHKKNNFYILSKTKILFLLIISSNVAFAQPKLFFGYDPAGNQISSSICINCRMANTTNSTKPETEKMITSDVSDKISYFPNPVKEELTVEWVLVDNKLVDNISITDVNGVLLYLFEKLNQVQTIAIPFTKYPSGLYIVSLNYSNGESKELKIIKQ